MKGTRSRSPTVCVSGLSNSHRPLTVVFSSSFFSLFPPCLPPPPPPPHHTLPSHTHTHTFFLLFLHSVSLDSAEFSQTHSGFCQIQPRVASSLRAHEKPFPPTRGERPRSYTTKLEGCGGDKDSLVKCICYSTENDLGWERERQRENQRLVVVVVVVCCFLLFTSFFLIFDQLSNILEVFVTNTARRNPFCGLTRGTAFQMQHCFR